jgi:predicted ATPase/class 3 adenylate cyclase
VAREDLPTGVVTLVFTDIEGSTRLLEELGDRYAEVLADHRQLLRSAFAAGGGVEVDTQGDAFFFAFPGGRGALEAVAEAQRALAAHAWPEARELRVRMGVHSGEPLRTPEGYVGLALHQGARVMACAHGRQIVVSAAAAAVAGELAGGLALRDLGDHRLKDLSVPQRLFQLCGEGLQPEFPPLKTLDGYFTNLPEQPSALLGRESELDELATLLATCRLVTLTGPGGTGKTRLALQVGAESLEGFPGGVFFCDLAPLRDSALLAATIAQSLGLREQPGESSEQTIAAYVADRRVLLVLDNLEQLLDATPVVARLLAACPNLRAIATSRAPLRLSGEREYPVESLALPDAMQLFQERASQLGQDALGQTLARETVEAICERLDRLPLALELAAARLRSLSLDQLLERLEQRLSLLSGGARDLPHRQRTLRATLDWSYELLAHDEQRVLSELGVFVGGFTLESAEQVAGADLDTLEGLIEHSLMRRRDDRYHMLETVREYALDRLQRAGELDAARMRHADWALGLLEQADPRDDQDLRVAFIDALAENELANLRQAIPLLIERRPDELATRVLAVLWTWMTAEQWRENVELVRAISAGTKEPPPAVSARIATAMANAYILVGELEAAHEHALRGIELAEETGEQGTLALCLTIRGYLAQAHGEPNADEWARRAVSIDRARAQPLDLARSLANLAAVTQDFDEAGAYYEEVIELSRADDPRFAQSIVYNLASLELQHQRFEAAEARLARQLRDGVTSALLRAYVGRGLGIALAGRRADWDAARLIGAGDAAIDHSGLHQDPTETGPRAAALARIEAAIGAGDMQEALDQGRRLQIDQAVELALSLTSSGRRLA